MRTDLVGGIITVACCTLLCLALGQLNEAVGEVPTCQTDRLDRDPWYRTNVSAKQERFDNLSDRYQQWSTIMTNEMSLYANGTQRNIDAPWTQKLTRLEEIYKIREHYWKQIKEMTEPQAPAILTDPDKSEPAPDPAPGPSNQPSEESATKISFEVPEYARGIRTTDIIKWVPQIGDIVRERRDEKKPSAMRNGDGLVVDVYQTDGGKLHAQIDYGMVPMKGTKGIALVVPWSDLTLVKGVNSD